MQVVSHPSLPAVYALAPDTGTVHEIDTESLDVRRHARCGERPVAMHLGPDGENLWVLCAAPRRLVRLSLGKFQANGHVTLPGEPGEFDLSPDGTRAAVSFPDGGQTALLDLGESRVVHVVKTGSSSGVLRYRSDGRIVLIGDPAEKALSVIDASSGDLMVRLPLAVRPEHVCVGGGGGQLFVTGEGMDAVVAVYPYQTQVGATILAGSRPGFVAASGEYLFVANPASGDVTILDIGSQRVIAVAAVGREPGYVTFTPDGRYALVLNRRSGDMAVIRMASLSGRRSRFVPLFMTVPVGSEPVSAAVRGV